MWMSVSIQLLLFLLYKQMFKLKEVGEIPNSDTKGKLSHFKSLSFVFRSICDSKLLKCQSLKFSTWMEVLQTIDCDVIGSVISNYRNM